MNFRRRGVLSFPRLSHCSLLASVTMVVGCATGDRPATTVRLDSTPIRSLPWVATLEGEIHRPGTTQPFGYVTAGLVAAVDHDRIAAYDEVSGGVFLLSARGDSLGVIGRRGTGPGEFHSPSGLGIGPDGSIAVFDVAKASIVRFTATGAVLPERRIDGMHEGGPLLVTSDGVTLGVVEIDRAGRTLLHRLLFVPDSGDLRQHVAVREPLPVAKKFPGCPNPVVLAPLFAPKLRWAGGGVVVVAVTGTEYVLEFFGMAGDSSRVGRPHDPLRATRALALAAVPSGRLVQQAGACSVSPEAILDARGMAETVPEISRLVVAPNGEIWIRHGDLRPDGGGFVVHSSNGDYVGDLPTTFPFPAVFLDSLRFLTVQADSDDVNHIYIYRLSR